MVGLITIVSLVGILLMVGWLGGWLFGQLADAMFICWLGFGFWFVGQLADFLVGGVFYCVVDCSLIGYLTGCFLDGVSLEILVLLS